MAIQRLTFKSAGFKETATKLGYDLDENKEMLFQGATLKQSGEDEDTATFTISTNTLDRDMEVVEQRSLSYKNYRRNPVVLYGHDSGSNIFPVGKTVSLKLTDNEGVGVMRFAVKEYERARIVRDLVKGGYLNAVSIGMIGVEMDIEKRGEEIVGVYTKAEVIEISIVPIPANPDALRVGRRDEMKLEDLRTKHYSAKDIDEMLQKLS